MPPPAGIVAKTDADTGLIEKPALAPHFRFHPADGRQVFLVSETFNTLLHGAIYPDLLPLLDGRRPYRDIVAALSGKHAEAAVRTALVSLASKGYAVSGDYAMDPGRAAFWSALGASPRFAEARLAASTVTIVGDGGRLAERLQAMDVAVAGTDRTPPDTRPVSGVFGRGRRAGAAVDPAPPDTRPANGAAGRGGRDGDGADPAPPDILPASGAAKRGSRGGAGVDPAPPDIRPASGASGRDRRGVAGTDPTLSVILCDDYLDERHAELNRLAIESGAPWMLARPGGLKPLFGPVFRPAERGPCWACLAWRLRGHQEVHNFLRNLTDGGIALAPRASEPAAQDMILDLASVEIARWLVFGKRSPLHERAISLDLAELAIGRHPIMRRPQCLACGDESLYRPDRRPLPVALRSSPKPVRNSGGLRAVSPAATLAKYRHLVDPVGGVVTWLRRTTEQTDPWLHVHWAGSNLALKNRALSMLRLSLRTKSAGKGSTPRQSEASALCEALERYSGAFHGDEVRCRKRFADFRASGEPEAIHPNEIQLFSERQLDDAARINAGAHAYNVVPARLDPNAEIDWSPVWSLTRSRHRHLPTSLLYYGKSADSRGLGDFVADSNGCAAGNTLEEAIFQGFLELVERDAFAVWWYNRLRLPGVDLDSFGDDYLAAASDYYRSLNRDIWVLDVTGDLGIPSFVAISRRTDKAAEDIIYGAGAHPDPHIAALRAVCELNQFLNWVQGSGAGGAGYTVDDPQCLWWWRNATLADHPYLAPAVDAAPRGKSDYPVVETSDLREDVERCRALIEARGMEFLVLDQTRPDIAMPVARVIVPGLRHYWERFAPGRLYDVPVEMGWRDSPLTEAELNPAPVIS